MQLEKIPDEAHSDTIACFWMMMRQLEENARNTNRALDKLDVEGYYRVWNRMTGDTKVPHWLKEQQ